MLHGGLPSHHYEECKSTGDQFETAVCQNLQPLETRQHPPGRAPLHEPDAHTNDHLHLELEFTVNQLVGQPGGPPATPGHINGDLKRLWSERDDTFGDDGDMLYNGLCDAQDGYRPTLLPHEPMLHAVAPTVDDKSVLGSSRNKLLLCSVRDQLRHLASIVDDELRRESFTEAVPVKKPTSSVSVLYQPSLQTSSMGNADVHVEESSKEENPGALKSMQLASAQPLVAVPLSAAITPRSGKSNESPKPDGKVQCKFSSRSLAMQKWKTENEKGENTPPDEISTQDQRDMFESLSRSCGIITFEECVEIYDRYGDSKGTVVREMLQQLIRLASGDGSDIDVEAFLFLMTHGHRMPEDFAFRTQFENLRGAFYNCAKSMKKRSSRSSKLRPEAGAVLRGKSNPHTQPRLSRSKQPCVATAGDTLPAFVIMINALVIGVEADNSDRIPDFWEACELFFLAFFSLEFLYKVVAQGCHEVFFGPDRAWNYFDLFCICTAFFDRGISYIQKFSGGEAMELEGLMLIKMLRLARLARLVRLLRFKIFHELKMMIQGVVSGVRVLMWAIVLLFVCTFILGIVMRIMVGDTFLEFSTMDASMLTLFRCFTDGCTAYNGSPLQERIRVHMNHPGPRWAFAGMYMIVVLFITIGIFNLIMAIFIDNVVTAHIQRKQQQLGETADKTQTRISEVISGLFVKLQVENRAQSSIHGTLALSGVDEDDLGNCVITRDVFHSWLAEPDFLELLEDAEVETSTKYELFDALDVDAGGELTIEELVNGLMKLRGPISKNDIVATRLKVAYLTTLVEDIHRDL